MKVKIRPSTVRMVIVAMAAGAIAHSVARSMEVTFANVGAMLIILVVIALVISAVADSDDK